MNYKSVSDNLLILQKVERKTIEEIGKQLHQFMGEFVCHDKGSEEKLKYVGLAWYSEQFDRGLTNKRDYQGYAYICLPQHRKESTKYFNKLIRRYFIPFIDGFTWHEYGNYMKLFRNYEELNKFYEYYKNDINEVLQECHRDVEAYYKAKERDKHKSVNVPISKLEITYEGE